MLFTTPLSDPDSLRAGWSGSCAAALIPRVGEALASAAARLM